MLWTPIIRIPRNNNTIHNQLKDLKTIVSKVKTTTGIEIELIYNEKFYDAIQDLRKIAKKTTQAMTSPIMRFLQIEEKLKHKLKR